MSCGQLHAHEHERLWNVDVDPVFATEPVTRGSALIRRGRLMVVGSWADGGWWRGWAWLCCRLVPVCPLRVSPMGPSPAGWSGGGDRRWSGGGGPQLVEGGGPGPVGG